ncbi:unnamed protein product [Linum trigynum]|uniref:Uncharacterized protein n=1 Tax=Linum trigynum TaxID=586398 RepID=A0AAV2E088_9ROSI
MGGALSSLFELCIWLGRWLMQTMAILLATILRNQRQCWKASKFGACFPSEDVRMVRCRGGVLMRKPTLDPDCQRDLCAVVHQPDRLIWKRKRSNAFEEYESSYGKLIKRCRLQPLKGWRFWLPPSSELVGDKSCLASASLAYIVKQASKGDAPKHLGCSGSERPLWGGKHQTSALQWPTTSMVPSLHHFAGDVHLISKVRKGAPQSRDTWLIRNRAVGKRFLLDLSWLLRGFRFCPYQHKKLNHNIITLHETPNPSPTRQEEFERQAKRLFRVSTDTLAYIASTLCYVLLSNIF